MEASSFQAWPPRVSGAGSSKGVWGAAWPARLDVVTTGQIEKSLRIASGAQQHQALVNAVMTPELRKIMQEQGKRISEALNLQVKVRDVISPSLEALMREQNKRISEMLDSAGMRKALAGINFNLPEGWPEQVAAYRKQIVTELAVEDDAESTGGGLKRLAEEREAIITCLKRIGVALEGAKFIPNFPIPALVIYLFCMLVVLAEVANEKLSEREDDD
jgi:hypothetical protein